MIYLYDHFQKTKTPTGTLSKNKLLLPPLGCSHTPWTQGYFETLATEVLTEDDVLPVHCFWLEMHEKYFDERGGVLRKKTEPCGDWGLGSYMTIDIQLAAKLGFKMD